MNRSITGECKIGGDLVEAYELVSDFRHDDDKLKENLNKLAIHTLTLTLPITAHC
ncbi:hypothetical protein BsIDN1_17400 [Bacillus safensis]|uniref:Uncharacterized protein n=1 Tax=Bacillus safensis TaxID=561879 RepID=A0A5S9M654_BACIA|nr:hypothetical protein BsIDN1_17400 [Bacillus safensis]